LIADTLNILFWSLSKRGRLLAKAIQV